MQRTRSIAVILSVPVAVVVPERLGVPSPVSYAGGAPYHLRLISGGVIIATTRSPHSVDSEHRPKGDSIWLPAP